MDLESAVAAQVGDKPAEEVTDLVLDTCKAAKVTGLERFTNLRTLTLNGCGLTTLEGFPTLPKLTALELSDNQLSDGLDALQEAGLIMLKRLSLAGNKFSELSQMEPLGSLPLLRDLDLFHCPVTELEDYRSGLFDLLPSLQYLDGFDAEDNEKEEDEDDDEGDYDDDDDDEEDIISSSEGIGEEGDDGFDDDEGVSDSYENEGEASYDDGGEEGFEEIGRAHV